MEPSRTITRTGQRRREPRSGDPFVFVALRCDRPVEPGVRFRLTGAEAIEIGRAPALRLDRALKGGVASLKVGIPDPRMSSAHLRLQRVLGSWIAEDLGSKNGTLLAGRRLERAPLEDGALLELGHTFLLFRAALQGGGPDLLDGKGRQTLSPALADELERVERVARSRIPVLLRGESGTGKELLAREIHRLSGRPGPFVAVNCGAIAPGLVESELFGHRRGAFSGAVDDQAGFLRAADRGTLLLDEVGDLPLPAQAALLRALQEEEVVPVGGARPVKLDLRVVAATHRDLSALAAQEKFRPDLLARLSGYCCTLPPLRERREDFSLLVASLLARLGARDVAFSAEAARALLRYPWPLNVRELEKCLASAVVLAPGGRVELEHLPEAVREAPAPARPAAADRRRADELEALLREHSGNVTAVARALGKARTQVQRWLRRYRLDPLAFRR